MGCGCGGNGVLGAERGEEVREYGEYLVGELPIIGGSIFAAANKWPVRFDAVYWTLWELSREGMLNELRIEPLS